jgi:hypothetical protein
LNALLRATNLYPSGKMKKHPVGPLGSHGECIDDMRHGGEGSGIYVSLMSQ